MFKNELKRAFTSNGMKVSLLVGGTLCILYIISMYKNYYRVLDLIESVGGYRRQSLATPFDAWMLGHVTPYKIYYYNILPLLAVIPFAGTFCREFSSGYIKNVLIRTDRRKYLFNKYFAACIAGGFSTTLPVIVNLLWTFTYHSFQMPSPAGVSNLVGTGTILCDLYYSNPFVYCILFIMLIYLFSAIMTGASMIVSFFTKNIFSVYLIPFISIVLLEIVLQQKMAELIPRVFMDPGNNRYFICVSVLCIIAFIINSIIVINGLRKRDCF